MEKQIFRILGEKQTRFVLRTQIYEKFSMASRFNPTSWDKAVK